jgi:hypothetical protein
MKSLLFLIAVAAAGAAGYIFEPKIRESLTGKPENYVKMNKPIESGDDVRPETPLPVEPAVVESEIPFEPVAPPVETPPVVDTATVIETPPVDQPPVEVAPPPAVAQTDVVAVMQAHIRSGAVKSFNLDQVLEWKALDQSEVVDGVSYDVGVASFNSTTPFGVKTRQARALIKDGKVANWLWANSGMQVD